MNILLSSYDFHEEWAQDIISPLLKKDMKVIVIPFSFYKGDVKCVEDFDKEYGINGVHTPWILRPFHYYGLYDIEFIDYYRDSHEVAQKKAKSADVFFLTGGRPDEYLERLDEFGLSSIIKESHAIVIGASAGAMVQIDHYHITPDDDYPKYIYEKGLGLVSGLEVECHYCHSPIQDEGIGRVIQEKNLPTYTIANDGGLLVDKDVIIPFGNAYLINK